MIDRYAIKFAPAVSQKELEKALQESGDPPATTPDLKKIRAWVEFVGDFEDVKKLSALLKELSSNERTTR